MTKYNRIMEIFWLVVAIITFFIAIYIVYTVGLEEGYVFLFMPMGAGVLFGLRRNMRKRIENNE